MNRYLLFCGDVPLGGAHDFLKAFPTLETAVDYAVKNRVTKEDWWHLLDVKSGAVIDECSTYPDHVLIDWARTKDAEEDAAAPDYGY